MFYKIYHKMKTAEEIIAAVSDAQRQINEGNKFIKKNFPNFLIEIYSEEYDKRYKKCISEKIDSPIYVRQDKHFRNKHDSICVYHEMFIEDDCPQTKVKEIYSDAQLIFKAE